MRRIALGLAIAVVVCLTARAHGQDIYDCYNGSAEQGGNRTTTNGIQSLQYVQQSFPNAQVDVYLHNTTTHATIFQDGAGTVPLANPFSASAHGVAFVCAADGRYDFKYSLGGITTPFTVSDIKFCFNCSGGGGGGGLSGTTNQVIKFGTPTTGVNSSGGPDDGVHVVPWLNGLSIENASLDKTRPNGTNCTTPNLLVEYDGNTIANVASVQTAAISSQHVIGVADQGAGCSGSVRIADHGYHACIFDNQTTIHDAVIASASVAGECSDGGGSVQGTQVVGRVASVNTGPGTVATVDWFTGDTQQATGSITSCSTGGSNAYYPGIGQVISCDPLILDDGNGGLTFNNASFSGFWYQKQGTLLTQAAMKANSFYFSAGPSVSASYGLQPPSSIPTAGNCAQFSAGDATGYIKITDAGAPCGTGSGATFQTNAVNNTLQSTLNNQNGLGITVTNPSAGNVNYALTDATQIATPTAPTLTVNGTPGSTTITYKIVACEESTTSCTHHTAASGATSVTTANATLSSSNSVKLSGYADTLYGARCYDVYRTAAGGTPSTTGLIGHCVGKIFADTGLAGDSSTAPTTNNTLLLFNPAALPGCNSPPFDMIGPDAPPCSPNALNEEFRQTYGAPADVNNPFFTWINQQAGVTAIWSNGTIVLTSDTGGQYSALSFSAPGSAPYTFITYVDTHGINTGDGCGIGYRESATGKVAILELVQNGASGTVFQALNGTLASVSGVGSWGFRQQGAWLALQNTGTAINYLYSLDGIVYQQLGTQAIGTPFTTAPNQFFLGTRGLTTTTICVFDFERRTQ